MKNDIVIIGAGRLGTSLAAALAGRGYPIKAISCRTMKSAEESRKIIGQGREHTDPSAAAREGNLIFITVPDDALGAVAEKLASNPSDWKKKHVFHCSGIQPASALVSLKKAGASTASMHPVQSFPEKRTPPSAFEGIFFGLEGDSKACELGGEIVQALGARTILIQAGQKAIYHAACATASNLFVALLDTARNLLLDTGISRDEAEKLLLPLVQGTLQNVKKLGISGALTGPLQRGDTESVKKHVAALGSHPEALQIYTLLTRHAAEMAGISGIKRSVDIKKTPSLREEK